MLKEKRSRANVVKQARRQLYGLCEAMVPPNVQKLYINLFFFIDPRVKKPQSQTQQTVCNVLSNHSCMRKLGSGIRLPDVVNF